mgnify:FL=1
MALRLEFSDHADEAGQTSMTGLDRMVRLPEVLARAGFSRATLYRKIRAGTFPRQEPISDQGVGWRQSDPARWMADPGSYRAD